MQIYRCLALLAVSVFGACAPARVLTTPGPTPVAGSRIRYAVWSDTARFHAVRVIAIGVDSLMFESFARPYPERHFAGSVPIDSIARLQVYMGEDSHVARGVLIGSLVGGLFGVLCAAEDDEGSWVQVTTGECLAGFTLAGAGIGLLLGVANRNDVWAPTALPLSRVEPSQSGAVSVVPFGVGVRISVRLPSP